MQGNRIKSFYVKHIHKILRYIYLFGRKIPIQVSTLIMLSCSHLPPAPLQRRLCVFSRCVPIILCPKLCRSASILFKVTPRTEGMRYAHLQRQRAVAAPHAKRFLDMDLRRSKSRPKESKRDTFVCGRVGLWNVMSQYKKQKETSGVRL